MIGVYVLDGNWHVVVFCPGFFCLGGGGGGILLPGEGEKGGELSGEGGICSERHVHIPAGDVNLIRCLKLRRHIPSEHHVCIVWKSPCCSRMKHCGTIKEFGIKKRRQDNCLSSIQSRGDRPLHTVRFCLPLTMTVGVLVFMGEESVQVSNSGLTRNVRSGKESLHHYSDKDMYSLVKKVSITTLTRFVQSGKESLHHHSDKICTVW